MFEGVLARDAFLRVEREELREEVECQGVRGGVELKEGDSGLVGEGADVVLGLEGEREGRGLGLGRRERERERREDGREESRRGGGSCRWGCRGSGGQC